MCDGSVRFLKDSTNSWTNDFVNHGSDPPGLFYGPDCGEVRIGTAKVGVLQALSTRASNETIRADAY
jgi:hypothetical protein